MSDALAAAAVGAFDADPLDLSGQVAEIDRFRTELAGRVDLLEAEVGRRVTAGEDALTAHDTAAATGARRAAARRSARAVR